MAKPFDATTKDLLESDPLAWMVYLGLHPQGTVEVIDSDIPPESAPMVLQRIDERLIREATEPEAARLMSSTFLLAGLRFEEETIDQLFFGVQTMNLLDSKILKDSSSYRLLQKIEERVRVEEARSILIGLATDRFGEPTETQKALLDGITDHDRLFRLCKKVGSLSTWDELLASEVPA
jgi:hypothetical protein